MGCGISLLLLAAGGQWRLRGLPVLPAAPLAPRLGLKQVVFRERKMSLVLMVVLVRLLVVSLGVWVAFRRMGDPVETRFPLVYSVDDLYVRQLLLRPKIRHCLQ